MAILIMTIGALVVLLISNTMVIISNPQNTIITSIVTSSLFVPGGDGAEGGSPFPLGNRLKEPRYIDVHPDRIILYPGEQILPVRDMDRPQNALERFLEEVREVRDYEYVVLLVRPRAADVYRRIARAVRDREIDLGIELFEAGREVDYEARHAAAMRGM